MHYKISMIIPIYNGENSIKRSMTSLMNQTIGFKNIEVILVNDCSTDKTKNIIAEYSKKYKNCKSINLTKNSGFAGAPRNKGIINATSQYIMFLDCDDEYLNDACETFYKKITEENVDLVESLNQYERINNKKIYRYPEKKIQKYPSQIKIRLKECYKFKNIHKLTCLNAIYKKSIIQKNSIVFPEDIYGEDAYFRLNYLLKCKEILVLNDYYGILLNFNETNENKSLTHKHDFKAFNSCLKGLYSIKKLIENHPKKKDIEKNIMPSFYKDLLTGLLIEISFLNVNNSQKIELFKKIYNLEKYINCKINPEQKWALLLNNYIMEKKFKKALILSNIFNFLNNKFIKNIYRKIKRTEIN